MNKILVLLVIGCIACSGGSFAQSGEFDPKNEMQLRVHGAGGTFDPEGWGLDGDGLEVESIHFYEGHGMAPDVGSYFTRFNNKSTHYIYAKPVFKNLSYGGEERTYKVLLTYYDGNGDRLEEVTYDFKVHPNWVTCWFDAGVGSMYQAGFWKPGTYTIKVTGDGITPGEASFTIE